MISKQQLKRITSLQQKKYRNELGAFVIEGAKLIEEALRDCPGHIAEIYYTTRYKDQLSVLNIPTDCQITELSDTEFDKITSLISPQGVLAILNKFQPILPVVTNSNDLILMVEKVGDPGNFGTIIRLADWFGIEHIVCSEDTVDCYNSKVVQASMGAILRINIVYTDLVKYIRDLKLGQSIIIYGTSLGGVGIHETILKTPAIIVFGNESTGMSEKIKEYVDQELLIPNYSDKLKTTESLNVSIATAIVCSEFRRQQHFPYSK